MKDEVKVIPIDSGCIREVSGKEMVEYHIKAGIEISVPKHLIKKLEARGLIKAAMKYNSKKKDN